MKAPCTARNGTHICGKPARHLMKHPTWKASVIPVCEKHRSMPGSGLVVVASSSSGFDIDRSQLSGTAAYFGVTLQENGPLDPTN